MTSSIVEDDSSSPNDIKTLLSSIDPEHLKKLIQEVAEKRFNSLKVSNIREILTIKIVQVSELRLNLRKVLEVGVVFMSRINLSH